jgi:hypothetical protein
MRTEQDIKVQANLSVKQSVDLILLKELHSLVYHHKGSAYIKFINIAIGIEFLGACLDQHPFAEFGESENRFNKALKKLFPTNYRRFANEQSENYFFREFRGPFIHQLRPGKNIVVTHRDESAIEGTKHLVKTESGFLVLVLEDFFDDFEKACKNLLKLNEKGKLPTKKIDQEYIKLFPTRNNK